MKCGVGERHEELIRYHVELARLSHLVGIEADKYTGMSKGHPKVFTTKRG
jgi:hypothetical protein